MQYFVMEEREYENDEWSPPRLSDYIKRKSPCDIKERRLGDELEEIVLDTPVESEAIRAVDIYRTQAPNSEFRVRKVIEHDKGRKVKSTVEMPGEIDYDEPRPSDIKWVMSLIEFVENDSGDILNKHEADRLGMEHSSISQVVKLLADSLKNSINFIDYLESKLGEDEITPEEEFETQMMEADRFSELSPPRN